jgi:hypothetical protein
MANPEQDKLTVAKGIQRLRYATAERAYLGEPLGGGQFLFDSVRTGRTRARIIRGSDEAIVALVDVINHKIPRRPDIRVLIDLNRNGEWEVIDVDSTYAMESAGVIAEGIGVGPHTHRIGFGLEDAVESRRLEPGLVVVSEGMLVYVYPFYYTFARPSIGEVVQ